MPQFLNINQLPVNFEKPIEFKISHFIANCTDFFFQNQLISIEESIKMQTKFK